MKPPIIVLRQHQDITIYKSFKDAQFDTEPMEEYCPPIAVWDAEGNVIQVTFTTTLPVLVPTQSKDVGGLRETLITYLSQENTMNTSRSALVTKGTAELISMSSKFWI